MTDVQYLLISSLKFEFKLSTAMLDPPPHTHIHIYVYVCATQIVQSVSVIRTWVRYTIKKTSPRYSVHFCDNQGINGLRHRFFVCGTCSLCCVIMMQRLHRCGGNNLKDGLIGDIDSQS